jgi:hypothetical protein
MHPLRGLRRSRDETRFHLGITCDTNTESGVGKVVDEISGPTENHFVAKNYGLGLHGIGVVLMCRDPELNFKRRLRFSKKDKMLYMDIMLDLGQMRQAEHGVRKKIVVERLGEEIPTVLSKYSIGDFDEARFVKDLKGWLTEIAETPYK